MHSRRWLANPLKGVKQLGHGVKAVGQGAKQLARVVEEAQKDHTLQAAAVGFAIGFTLADAALKPNCGRQHA